MSVCRDKHCALPGPRKARTLFSWGVISDIPLYNSYAHVIRTTDSGGKTLNYMYNAIYILNFAIIGFLSLVIYRTTYMICDGDQARNFLEVAKYLPHVPWHVPVYSVTSFLCIGVSNVIKKRVGEKNPWLSFLLFLLDFCLYVFITYNLNFSYKGLFLLLGAGAFLFIPNIPMRFMAIALAMTGFIFFDYDIITVRLTMVSLQDYISFYAPQVQIPLYSVKSTLSSLNLMFIVLFFQVLIQSKVKENKEFIRLNNELTGKIYELETLQGKLEEAAKLKERNRLAHEIHDILGHSLTSISTGLEACLEMSRNVALEMHERLVKIKHVSDKGLTDIRRSVRELKNDAIEKSSLLEAIKELVADADSIGRTRAKLKISGVPISLEDDEEQTVYRLIQESMTNSIKHGRARSILIELMYCEQHLQVRISDDGEGCDLVVKHFGLRHIEEQVALLGGTVSFVSQPGHGFITTASILLRKGGRND
jgi:signal transduction histidine kinase